MKRRLLRVLGSLFGLLLFGVALWILHRQLRTHSINDILRSLREIPSRQVLLCLALTCLNYFMMTGYDFLAYRKIAMASFISFAFSVNMGLGTVAVSASVRRGDPASVIVETAASTAADIIVLGTRGKAGAEAFWARGVTAKVLGKTTRPFLLVPVTSAPGEGR